MKTDYGIIRVNAAKLKCKNSAKINWSWQIDCNNTSKNIICLYLKYASMHKYILAINSMKLNWILFGWLTFSWKCDENEICEKNGNT